MLRSCFVAAVAVVVVPCPGQDTEPAHLLRMSYDDAATTWYCVRQDMDVDVSVNGDRQNHRLRLDMYWKRAVNHTDEGAPVFVDSLARFLAAGRDTDENGATTFTFDSAGEAVAPRQLEQFVSIIDAPIERIVDSRGVVRRLQLPERLQEMDAKSGVRSMTTSNLIVPAVLELPELPVPVGASWQGTNDTSRIDNEEVTVRSVYTLQSVVKGQAQIKQLLTVTPVEDTAVERAGGEKAEAGVEEEVEVEAETSAADFRGRRTERTFRLDMGSGRIVSVEEDTVVEESPTPAPDLDLQMKFTSHRHGFPTDEPKGELEPIALPEREAEESPDSPGAKARKAK